MFGQYPFKSLDRGNQPLALAGDRPYVSQPAQPVLEQTLLHLGATNDPLSGGTIVKGSWEFEAKIPRHKLWITVAADGTRSTVRRVGLGILRTLS